MRFFLIPGIIVLFMAFAIGQQADRPALYLCDFQQVEPPVLPSDLKVLAGEFSVKQDGTNRFLELSFSPLNSFGLLLGPERGSDTLIRARLRSWPTGKRNPEFGVGLGGVGGCRLILMPAVGELQVRQTDKILARTSFAWKPGTWVHLRLEIGGNLVVGKAWHEGESEPADWTIRLELTEQSPTGRASLWGTPYSGKPIQFDDLRVEAR